MTQNPVACMPPLRAPRRARFAWCLFDFANSSFPTVALTAFGAPYFVGVLAGEEGVQLGSLTIGPSALWGLAMAVSMLAVTVISPILGAFADHSGKKRALLFFQVTMCVAATAALGYVPPHHGWWAFGLYVVANIAFEAAYVVYNAFLPELVEGERVGRLSANAWALGYVGGLLVLILCKPWMPQSYDPEHAGSASTIYLIVALWYLVFSIPSLVFLPSAAQDRTSSLAASAREAWLRLRNVVSSLRAHRTIAVFLIAYFLYTDGIATVIEFTGVYTKEVLAFTPQENITLFLILNIVAAPGALLFGHLVDRIGAQRAISHTLVIWMLVVTGAVLAQNRTMFWPVAGLAAVVLGATQAASRAWMARLAPRERMGEFMGFLSFSGKASAVMGPMIYGALADGVHVPSQPGLGHRLALGVIGIFFVVAWYVVRQVQKS